MAPPTTNKQTQTALNLTSTPRYLTRTLPQRLRSVPANLGVSGANSTRYVLPPSVLKWTYNSTHLCCFMMRFVKLIFIYSIFFIPPSYLLHHSNSSILRTAFIPILHASCELLLNTIFISYLNILTLFTYFHSSFIPFSISLINSTSSFPYFSLWPIQLNSAFPL